MFSQRKIYLDYSLLGCDVVHYGKWLLMFQRMLLPPSSGFYHLFSCKQDRQPIAKAGFFKKPRLAF